MVFQRLIPSLVYLHPVLYSFAQGFILLCRTCIPNENEASGMRNKMSVQVSVRRHCHAFCFFSDSGSPFLRFLVVANACWLEQVWVDQMGRLWRDR